MTNSLQTISERVLSWVEAAQHQSGGIASFSIDGGGWGALYPEASGYLIPTLVKYGRVEAALRAADWLLTKQLPDGMFPNMSGVATLFDTAAAIEGLRVAQALTLDKRYDDALILKSKNQIPTEDYRWENPMYNLRAAAIFEVDTRFDWETPERSHYLAYALEGRHRTGADNVEFDGVIKDLNIPANGLLHFTYAPGWVPVGERRDLCATLQIAQLLWLRGRKLEAELMVSSVAEHVRADGGVPLDPARSQEAFSWSAKFFLDACWAVSH